MRRSFLIATSFWAAFIVSAVTFQARATEITFTSLSGNWSGPTPTGVSTINNGVSISTISWGPSNKKSRYIFKKNTPPAQTALPTPLFPLGTFTHVNTIGAVPAIEGVDLNIVLSLTVDGNPRGPFTFKFHFNHEETTNTAPCAYGATDGVPCNDRVTFASSPSPTTFNVGGVEYTLAMSFLDNAGNPVAQFITKEGVSNVANLIAQITVPAVNNNNAPVADNQSISTLQDTSKTLTLTASDIDGNSLTYNIATPPQHGTVSGGTGASRTYTPDAGYFGSDSFTFNANDGTVESNAATISVTVTQTAPTNNVPVASPQSVSTDENTDKSITLGATDADGNPLTYDIVAAPLHGTISGGTGSLRIYTPTTGYFGSDSFTFKANDGTVYSNVATVSITVIHIIPPNNAPVALTQSVSVAYETAKSITLTATDDDNDPLTYTVMSQPLHGNLTGTGATLSYMPDLGYSGTDSFMFKASDGSDESNLADISITVVQGTVEAPTISPNGGTFSSPVAVTLLDGTPGAAIHYTTDGSLPTSGSPVYTAPLTLSANAVVKAIAIKSGMFDSVVASANFTINLPTAETPAFTPNGGTFTESVFVTINSGTSGVTIKYTTDGSNPKTSPTALTGDTLNLTVNSTLRAYAFKSGMNESAIGVSGSFIIRAKPEVNSIVISPKNATVNAGHHFPFTYTVYDQYGAMMPGVTATWSSTGGSIGAAPGTTMSFTAPMDAQVLTVTVSANSKSDSAQVRIVSENAGANLSEVTLGPVPYKGNSGEPGVTFRNLPPDTKIRIFTTNGRLVQTLTSPNGDQVVWEVNNANFDRVASGVYMYLIENGSQRKQGKLVIIQ